MADMLGINGLPQKLIEEIVSRTSPVDACGTLSVVSKKLRSAANSDHVWERFLPLDYPWEKIDSDTLHAFPTKKDLYLYLSDNPLLIDDDGDTFCCLEKLSGNKCFRIGSWDLIDNMRGWMPLEPSFRRFTDTGNGVAVLCDALNLEVEGKINTSLLSPNTNYTAYHLFNFSRGDLYFFGLGAEHPLETWVGIDGHGENRNVYIPNKLDIPLLTRPQYPVRRHDHMYEVELGDYLNKESGVGSTQLRMSLREVKSRWKRMGGLVFYGIEIRPKSSIQPLTKDNTATSIT